MDEKLYDAINRYNDDYNDVVNNLPQDVIQQVSRYLDNNCHRSYCFKKVNKLLENVEYGRAIDSDRIIFLLKKAMDIADGNIEITGQMFKMVDTRLCNLDNSEEALKLHLKNANKRMSTPMPDNNDIDSDSIDEQNTNNSNKRPKRNVTKLSTTSSTIQNKIKNTNTSNKKSKVQPTKIKKVVSGSESSNSDGDGDDLQPTYCICEEISYGDMIGCDNDLCPLEWCHFGCVSVSRKPKGKWYCPFCRGTNSKTMKPKKVFLKELEKYNKRKEEN